MGHCWKKEASYTAIAWSDTSTDSLASFSSEKPRLPTYHRRASVAGSLLYWLDCHRRFCVFCLASLLAVFGLMTCLDDPSPSVSGLTHGSQRESGAISWQSAPSSLKTCKDPWRLPGFIWYGEDSLETIWTPYSDMPTPEIPASLVDPPLQSDPQDLERLKALLSLAKPGPPAPPSSNNDENSGSSRPTSLTSLLMQPDAADNPDLQFLRNRNIAIAGSSIDRDAIWSFCHRVPGHTGVKRAHHRYLYCHYPAFNLTLQTWFHFGMHQTDGEVNKGQDSPTSGVIFEDRLEKAFLPLVEKSSGRPNFLMLSSGRWDTQFFGRWKEKLKVDAGGLEIPRVKGEGAGQMWYGELAYQRARVVDTISNLKSLFPEAPFLLRLESAAEYTNGDVANFQLEQSYKYLAHKLDIPLFHWADLIRNVRSKDERKDYMHWNEMSHVNWLFGEMLLWHVKYMTDPEQDTSCLLNRALSF